MWVGGSHNRSRRCEECDINWPHSASFSQCPCCDGPVVSSDEEPIMAGVAADLVVEANQRRAERQAKLDEFEAYCRARDETYVQGLVAALDLLPTADPDYDHLPAE